MLYLELKIIPLKDGMHKVISHSYDFVFSMVGADKDELIEQGKKAIYQYFKGQSYKLEIVELKN